jgi:hypothetical protein
MLGLESYLNTLMSRSGSSSPKSSTTSRTSTSTRSTSTPSTTPTYSEKNPPPGFTSSQWKQLLSLSKNNPTLTNLISQFTGSLTTPQPSQAWRRENPTNTSQLLRQLSFNAGEMGMPQGYVGGVQLPAYGTGLPAQMLTDTKNYGRQPGYGEANFFQQSMKGGMAPIAAMSPLGVPEGWNPGGSSSGDLKSQLEKYLQNLGGGSGGSGSDEVLARSKKSGKVMPFMSVLAAAPGGNLFAGRDPRKEQQKYYQDLWNQQQSRSSAPAPAPTPGPAPEAFPIFGGTPITAPYGT